MFGAFARRYRFRQPEIARRNDDKIQYFDLLRELLFVQQRIGVAFLNTKRQRVLFAECKGVTYAFARAK